MSPSFSRRGLFKVGALALTAGAIGAAVPNAAALGPIRGTIIDYSAGVPSPQAIKKAGHMGAIRYVSDKRPDAAWMAGKPVTLKETKANAAAGLPTASVYQFGRAETADWKQGAAGAAIHAPKAIALHKKAGGPTNRPIYIAIDDNPTREQYTRQIRPYLQAFSKTLELAGYQTGVYGNYNTIEWAIQDDIGKYFWMHDWGSNGKIHPRTTIHQLPHGKQQTIGGVIVDVNEVYADDWGQWTPGKSAAPAPAKKPATKKPQPKTQPQATAPSNGSSDLVNQLSSQLQSKHPELPELPQVTADGVTFNGKTLSNDQIRQLAKIVAETVAKAR
ncbi:MULTISPECIES: DUF1906 domain-containing protein [Corynebacterium]|jgi:secreted protein|uniref:DUF1906 domain-containing protein n=2 Tax=Corynebacteriaceae TaxID=1653 RepID=UPI0003B887DF|nr:MULTISPECIES: DUF1906 domain-containing protein [Corynebacterium]WKS52925.1 DUF1906 domain-containing protein [Corynebacterium tuberculostearicum]ERS46811.1 hypothetical protein HMPREF1286_02340 [Corynebacterium sp. KPL1860]ERS47868.1 hypothetical protein HMPREF1282_01086 [Corynebacterium sp. KPL1856]ERS53391.1 hypothetical protein HMPREF1264_01949 [Corynebacterium sp. KPL1821]ERS59189.1 hypothetical protein HMPREF1260_01646 [Corynebacterium sp. KPL1817]